MENKKDIVLFYRKNGELYRNPTVKEISHKDICVELPSAMGDTEIGRGTLYLVNTVFGHKILYFLEH